MEKFKEMPMEPSAYILINKYKISLIDGILEFYIASLKKPISNCYFQGTISYKEKDSPNMLIRDFYDITSEGAYKQCEAWIFKNVGHYKIIKIG